MKTAVKSCRSPHRPLAAGGLALLLLLPGCVTDAVWKLDDGSPKFVTRSVPCEVQADYLRADHDPNRLLLADSRQGMKVQHALHGRLGEARSLMLRPDLFSLEQADVSGSFTTREGKSLVAAVDLRLSGRVRVSAWRQTAATNDLSPAARIQLDDAITSSLEGLPAVLGDCARRLMAIDTALLVPGVEDPSRVTAFVFVRASGRPVRKLGGVAARVSLTCEDRLRTLRKLSLFAEVKTATGKQLVKIDPAAFWLVSTLVFEHGVTVHRSKLWLTRVNPVSVANGQQSGGVPLALDLVQTHEERPPVSIMLSVVQVVLTPPAVLADALVVAPVAAGIFLFWIAFAGH